MKYVGYIQSNLPKSNPLGMKRCQLMWGKNNRKQRGLVYAVKAQTSLAPLSRFRGSHVTTAHAHQCCTFQSYA